MRKLLIKLLLIFLVAYAVYIFVSQQKMLNSYAKEKKQYEMQISEAKEQQADLNDTLSNIDSTEYIEKIAREKLDMYLPNEKIYIDIEK